MRGPRQAATVAAAAVLVGTLMASPSGAATLSHGLSSYAIDATSGKLTKLKEYPMGKNPNWIEIVDLP